MTENTNGGCSQRDSAEHERYAKASRSFNRIWKERDSAQPKLLEAILYKDNLNRAYKRVKANKGAAGIDGMSIEEALPYLKEHQQELISRIFRGKYTPSPVRRVEIPKPDGGVRKLGIPTVIDRTIQQAITQQLVPIYEPLFAEGSFGYRPGRSAKDAILKVKEYAGKGYTYAVSLDLSKYFDTLNHEILINLLRKTVKDERVVQLIKRYLKSGVMEKGVVMEIEEGSPQGGNLSPLLANIYLNEFDQEFLKRGVPCIRYADDIVLLAKSKRASERLLESSTKYLEEKLKLTVNREKSRTVSVFAIRKFKYLGFALGRNGNGIYVRVHPKSWKKFKSRLKELSSRKRCQSIKPSLERIKVDIKNIPADLKTSCRFCAWKYEKRNGQKTKMPYNPATGDRAKINDLRTFADFKTTLMAYAMGGYDGLGIAVGNGIGAFDLDDCFREDGTLNDTADTVLSIFSTAYVEKSPSGKGLRGFFRVPEDYVFDKTVYYINNRSKHLEVYMPGATNRFVTVTGDVYRTGEIPDDQTAMTTLLDSLMKRNKQVQQNHFQHHSYLDDEAVIKHAEEASNGDKFKKLYAGEWEELYGSQSDADMAMLSILAFWCGCDEEQMDRIFRTTGLMRPKWDRKQAGTTYGAISIRNAVNSCAAVYTPVNAQDIVDEEFSKLDEDDYIEFQPDLSKITVTLEEMAPHTNARYGRNEIGMGNMFADYFKQIARYNSERKGWYVYDGSVWRPDKGNLKVSELAKLLADIQPATLMVM